jgi:hypothetical protein
MALPNRNPHDKRRQVARLPDVKYINASTQLVVAITGLLTALAAVLALVWH